MQVRMLQTRRGTEDGYVVRRFDKGTTYEMSGFLARQFLANQWAFLVADETNETQQEE